MIFFSFGLALTKNSLTSLNTPTHFALPLPLTSEQSTSQVAFLDILVKLTPDNAIATDLYTKPTDKHLYLQPTSCHPSHITKNIPYSLALRLRRICSDDDSLNHRTRELKTQLRNRGYTNQNIMPQITKAKTVNRDNTLQYNVKLKNKRVPLVTTYHPNLPNLNGIFQRYWPIIQSHPRLKKAIPDLPILSYRRPRNIRSILVQAKIKSSNIPAQALAFTSQACGASRCVTCQHFNPTGTFKSYRTGRAYPIQNNANCVSSNIVYLIQCSKCGIQYVGETGTVLRLRMANHRSTIKNHMKHQEKPVANHFSQPDHKLADLQLIVIECLNKQPKFRRQFREKFWIETLDTYTPNGLNIREK